MQTPVFLDQLPDVSSVVSQKSGQYRHQRNRALLDLLLAGRLGWKTRIVCPCCGQDRTKSRSFSQTFMDFQRCSDCNSIYAAEVPPQNVLDELRLKQVAAVDLGRDREFEFVSLLNWISLTEARLERSLACILDVRFCTQALGWQDTVKRQGGNRTWQFLPLTSDGGEFRDLKDKLQRSKPSAVLIPAEMDRIAEPALLLQVIRENTVAGTILFIASSCADGLEYEILGADSPSFIPLDRLTVFSIQGFKNLAQKTGFKILETSTPGRFDAVILERYFKSAENADIPFWSNFFREADKNRLHDLQILLQRSLKSGVLRFVLETELDQQ